MHQFIFFWRHIRLFVASPQYICCYHLAAYRGSYNRPVAGYVSASILYGLFTAIRGAFRRGFLFLARAWTAVPHRWDVYFLCARQLWCLGRNSLPQGLQKNTSQRGVLHTGGIAPLKSNNPNTRFILE
jgi:hypothetical protein